MKSATKCTLFKVYFFDMIFDQIDNIDSIMTMFSWRRRQKFGVQIWLKNISTFHNQLLNQDVKN
jgi:hypothetical protein